MLRGAPTGGMTPERRGGLVGSGLAAVPRDQMQTRNTLEAMARLGHAARGAVYCLVGGLALLAAIGSGGQTGGSRSALQTLLEQPFGRVLLAVIALGFVFFATWRAVEAITDADRRGTSWKGVAIRGAHLGSAVIYVGLALSAVNLMLGRGGGGDDQAAKDWTAWLMAQPFGPWLTGLVGTGIAAAGVRYGIKACRGAVTHGLQCSRDAAKWIRPLGRLGFAARGVVFLLIGGFLIVAAVHSRAAEAKGIGGALRTLQAQPYGSLLLGITALGLFAFGVFGVVEGVFRRIDAPGLDEAKAVAHEMRKKIES
jgi:hypothetical protein